MKKKIMLLLVLFSILVLSRVFAPIDVTYVPNQPPEGKVEIISEVEIVTGTESIPVKFFVPNDNPERLTAEEFYTELRGSAVWAEGKRKGQTEFSTAPNDPGVYPFFSTAPVPQEEESFLARATDGYYHFEYPPPGEVKDGKLTNFNWEDILGEGGQIKLFLEVDSDRDGKEEKYESNVIYVNKKLTEPQKECNSILECLAKIDQELVKALTK